MTTSDVDPLSAARWTREFAPTSNDLHAVWGDGQGGLWAVGSGGTILRRKDAGEWVRCRYRGSAD